MLTVLPKVLVAITMSSQTSSPPPSLVVYCLLLLSTQLRTLLTANTPPPAPDEHNEDLLLVTAPSPGRQSHLRNLPGSQGLGHGNSNYPVVNFTQSRPVWSPSSSPTAFDFASRSLPRQHRLPAQQAFQGNQMQMMGRLPNMYRNYSQFYRPTNYHSPLIQQAPSVRNPYQPISSPSFNTNHPVTSADAFVGPDGKLKMNICDHPNGFLRRQKKLCRQYLPLMESVVRGYFMGLKECEFQFSSQRWNCEGHNMTLTNQRRYREKNTFRRRGRDPQSLKARVRIKTYLDKLLARGTRESAYVLAVTSAGVSHAVTKACSSGQHENCGCDRTIYDHPKEPNFEWSGCSDNIHFGAAFSRQFLDVRERSRLKRRPKLGMTNLHNNHVGRQAVINKMEVQCKCHGVSGSCEMRTCWRSLPKFRDLGDHLQKRFDNAILVDYIDKRLVPVDSTDGRFKYRRSSEYSSKPTGSADERNYSPTETDLIYISGSPTFCNHEPRYGSLGTRGRHCVEGSQGPDNCNHLCCSRGFKRETFIQEDRCHCKFQWCCKVICQTCRKTVVVSTCN